MHRFDLDNVVRAEMQGSRRVRVDLVGVKKADYDTVDKLAEGLAPEYVTIDIAHGHADTVKNMIGT
jgi:GMP reductase